jgi:hypothetical protein
MRRGKPITTATNNKEKHPMKRFMTRKREQAEFYSTSSHYPGGKSTNITDCH